MGLLNRKQRVEQVSMSYTVDIEPEEETQGPVRVRRHEVEWSGKRTPLA